MAVHANNTDTCEWSCWWLGYGNKCKQINSHDIFARATQQKTVLYISRLQNWKWKSCFCWFIQVYWSLDIKWFVWWCTYIKTDGPGLLYARTNFLIRKFGRCSISVKLCLFKTYCINFYGIELWSKYRKNNFIEDHSIIREMYKNVF